MFFFFKKRWENEAKCRFFTIFHRKTSGFFIFLRFLYFRKRILTKNATFFYQKTQFFTSFRRFFNMFQRKHNKTIAFSPLLSEKPVKPMLFQQF